MVALPRSPRAPESGPDRRDLAVRPEGWTLRYDNRAGDWMAYDYRAADRRLSVSGSLPWETSAWPLGGVVCAVLLGLRQRTLLHGACMALGERSYGLLGASGHGKSTLAAALVREGAALLTEDLLVAARAPWGWRVEPGAPTLHLLEDSYAALASKLGSPATGAATVRDGKYALDLSSPQLGTGAVQAPLAGLYILDPPSPDGAARLTRLKGRRALLRLLDHLYGAGWIRPLGQSDLDFCSALVAEVPIHAVSRPWRLGAVGETAAMLRRHWAAGAV